MSITRPVVISTVSVVALVVGVFFTFHGFKDSSEQVAVRTQYEKLRTAISSCDTNAVKALFAPDIRDKAYESAQKLARFAKPLGWKSCIRISGSHATIRPDLQLLLPRWLPDGHAIVRTTFVVEWRSLELY